MAEKIKTMQADQHPIGSIYLSVDATNPAVWFGGTWERLKDRFLLAAGDTYAAGSTGGEATHVLTVDEMPEHRHTANTYNATGGSAWTLMDNNRAAKNGFRVGENRIGIGEKYGN